MNRRGKQATPSADKPDSLRSSCRQATAWTDPWSSEADVKVAALHQESQSAPGDPRPSRVRMEGEAVRRAQARKTLPLRFAAR